MLFLFLPLLLLLLVTGPFDRLHRPHLGGDQVGGKAAAAFVLLLLVKAGVGREGVVGLKSLHGN